MPVKIPLNLNELEKIADNYDTPYYLYDEESIKNNARIYMYIFKKYFPNMEQYYAVKALPNPSILNILKECGMGFDCSSPEEIQIVNIVDYYRKTNIMYTSNYTSKKDLKWILQNYDNITINLDSIDCLQNLLDASKETNIKLPDTICFRYNPIMINDEFDITDLSHLFVNSELILKSDKDTNKIKDTDKNKIENLDLKKSGQIIDILKSNNFSGKDTKFGMTFKYIKEAYKLAKTNGIKKFGIHVMPHSNCMDIKYWTKLIDHMFQVIYEIAVKLDIEISFLDIGGGIGIPYKPNQKNINLEELVMSIYDRFKYNTEYYEIKEPQLITECGRYITGPYGWLVSRCQSIKYTDTDIFYGLDSSMANLMRPGMYNAYHHITIPRLDSNLDNFESVNVVGTLCENNDWFAKKRELPIGIKKGDLFVIHDCGAHAYSMGFNYNSKLHCPEILLKDNNIQEIRKKENIHYHLKNTLMYQNMISDLYTLIFLSFLLILFVLYFFNR